MAPAALLLALALVGGQAAPSEVVAQISVQGNVVTSDADIQRLAGVQLGMPVAARLRATRRFQRVEVRKRFASIADPSQIVLVIIVDEGPVAVKMTGDPNHPTEVVKRRWANLLWLPILSGQDGYGLTYGVQLARTDLAGAHSRVSVPLSWGGQKQAGIELDKLFDRGPLSRVRTGGSVSQATNPHYDADDDRWQVWARGERAITPPLRVGATIGWQRVAFLGVRDSVASVGADLTLDTRLDPFLARNAVYARAAWDRFAFADGATNRTELEARGYIGLVGQPILVLRALRDDADRPLPAYLRPLLGGSANLRGFSAGASAGDTLVAASAELLVPLSSPLSVGKFGVNAFVDTGAAYDKGERLADQAFRTGIGGGVWFAAAFLRVGLGAAHGIGASTHVYFGVSTSF
jgi:outer membrane protein assembly factor BamA